MAGVGKFDGRLCGNLVAHFTDENDIRIVTQNTADRLFERHLRADLQLPCPFNDVLDRFFNRQDVNSRIDHLI